MNVGRYLDFKQKLSRSPARRIQWLWVTSRARCKHESVSSHGTCCQLRLFAITAIASIVLIFSTPWGLTRG